MNAAFFPEDVQYWSYIDVWLPNDANLSATNETARKVEETVKAQAAKFAQEHAEPRQSFRIPFSVTSRLLSAAVARASGFLHHLSSSS